MTHLPSRFHDLLGRTFRASPSYELVLFDRLSPKERGELESLGSTGDPDFYGLLRPRAAPAVGTKSADRETALLFLTLREPGPLPAYVRTVFGEAGLRGVARLVADGVLEVESGGTFVSGPGLELERGGGPRVGQGRLAELSIAALRYAQSLPVEDPLRLSMRLYGYNRRPLTPQWKRLLPSSASVEAYLGIAAGGPSRKILGRSWSALPPSEAWRSWRSRRNEPPLGDAKPVYKLYVSPVPEALPDTFGAIAEALAAARAQQLKVGVDVWGLLRPDKIVAYFPSFERLAEAASLLGETLPKVEVQGVPFTAEVGGNGLFSWGVDPPAAERSSAGRESWRLWLTHRLARALLAARAAGSADGGSAEPWHFALDRLALEGVDTASWTPGALLRRGWSEG